MAHLAATVRTGTASPPPRRVLAPAPPGGATVGGGLTGDPDDLGDLRPRPIVSAGLEVHDPAAVGLGVLDRPAALQQPRHGHRAPQQVDIAHAQRGDLAPPQAGVGGEPHEQVVRRTHMRRQALDLGRRPEARLMTAGRPRRANTAARVVTDQPRIHGCGHDRAHREQRLLGGRGRPPAGDDLVDHALHVETRRRAQVWLGETAGGCAPAAPTWPWPASTRHGPHRPPATPPPTAPPARGRHPVRSNRRRLDRCATARRTATHPPSCGTTSCGAPDRRRSARPTARPCRHGRTEMLMAGKSDPPVGQRLTPFLPRSGQHPANILVKPVNDQHKREWTLPESNRWPPPCKGGALPIELRARGSPATRSGAPPRSPRRGRGRAGA